MNVCLAYLIICLPTFILSFSHLFSIRYNFWAFQVSDHLGPTLYHLQLHISEQFFGIVGGRLQLGGGVLQTKNAEGHRLSRVEKTPHSRYRSSAYLMVRDKLKITNVYIIIKSQIT